MLSSAALLQYDQIDLGLASHFLNDGEGPNFKLSACLIALSGDARHLALASKQRILLLPVQAAGQPLPLGIAQGDEVRSLCWIAPAGDYVLLAGAASGQLTAFSAQGARLWAAQLHDSPLIMLLPSAADETSHATEPALLCLFEAGVVACARSKALAGAFGGGSTMASGPPFWRHELPEEAEGCRAIVCCGRKPELPLTLRADEQEDIKLILVAANPTALQLHTITVPWPRKEEADAGRGRVARGLGALQSLLSRAPLSPTPRSSAVDPTAAHCTDEVLA